MEVDEEGIVEKQCAGGVLEIEFIEDDAMVLQERDPEPAPPTPAPEIAHLHLPPLLP